MAERLKMSRPQGWLARRRVELARKLASLDDELMAWRERATGDMPHHHSQIKTTTAALERAADRVRPLVEGDALERHSDDIARTILDLHRIWEFFRSKLILRDNDLFRPFLRSADQLAWECWSRTVDGATSRGIAIPKRPPPLVFLNGARMPFMMSRDTQYQPEPVPASPITREELVAILRKLPVPVIGLPWSSVTHAPDALAVAHEVGHVIEEDLGLTEEIEDAIAAAVSESTRREAWTSWGGELFADAFGIAAVGPAYLGVLADALSADSGAVALETRMQAAWGSYPTIWLRVAFAIAVIDALEMGASAGESWRAHYVEHAMTAFEKDVPHVARAIACTTYARLGNTTLKALLATPMESIALTRSALLRNEGAAIPSDDARAVIAGARLAFEEHPARFAELKGHRRVVAHLDTFVAERATMRGSAGDVAPGVELFDALTTHWAEPPAP